eukprot:3291314-Rhodomonas_salina.1
MLLVGAAASAANVSVQLHGVAIRSFVRPPPSLQTGSCPLLLSVSLLSLLPHDTTTLASTSLPFDSDTRPTLHVLSGRRGQSAHRQPVCAACAGHRISSRQVAFARPTFSALVLRRSALTWARARARLHLARKFCDEKQRAAFLLHGAQPPAAGIAAGEIRPESGRKLRVGLMSADFRSHPMGPVSYTHLTLPTICSV